MLGVVPSFWCFCVLLRCGSSWLPSSFRYGTKKEQLQKSCELVAALEEERARLQQELAHSTEVSETAVSELQQGRDNSINIFFKRFQASRLCFFLDYLGSL